MVSVEKSTFSTGPYGDSGYAVRVQVRNGTSKEREIKYTGFGGEGAGHMSLILSDDSSYTVASSTGSYITDFYAFSSTTLAPGANANATLKFIVPAEVLSSPATPKKLLIAVDPKAINPNYSGFRYPIADPSFRVFLKCKTSVKSADGKTP